MFAPTQAPTVAAAFSKSTQTQAMLVDAALRLASQVGLQGLTIGAIAELTGMSKSGVFSRFGSRDELQIAVIAEYFNRFERTVFRSAMQQPRGLRRVEALFENWMQQVVREVDEGCLFISGATEFDDHPGSVRDALNAAVSTWLKALRRAIELAVEMGHLRAQTDVQQFQFELHGLILAVHYEARFLRSRLAIEHARAGFRALIARNIH